MPTFMMPFSFDFFVMLLNLQVLLSGSYKSLVNMSEQDFPTYMAAWEGCSLALS